MAETSDALLIELLDKHRELVGQILDHWDRYPRAGQVVTNPPFLDMEQEVAVALASHPTFRNERCLHFPGRQVMLSPSMQARNLLFQAARKGSEFALGWLYKIWPTEAADIDIITEVQGLDIRQAVTFSNGVRLIPASALIDSPQARMFVQSSFWPMAFGFRSAVAAVITSRAIPTSNDADGGSKEYLEKLEAIRRTVTAFSLSGKHTPTVGVSWVDFHDADLTATCFGYLWSGATYDGRESTFPVAITQDALDWVERLLALRGPLAAKCDVALARLNLAYRRQTPGDQAIDGCIALESLLTDGQAGDLTYKLRLRAARFLGSSYIERQDISAAIGRFYKLRGKVVHGQSKGVNPEDRAVAQSGLNHTLAALRKVVMTAAMPNVSELELGPTD